MKRPTIADVARSAAVSPTSVSFAFNRPERVSDETRERILSAAAELGYAPDPVARSMSIGRTGTIGVLVPQPLASVVHNPYMSEFLAGVAEAAETEDLPIMLVGPRQGSIEHAIFGAAVDGFLTIGLEPFRPTIQLLTTRRLPYVMVDSDAVDGVACVNADDTAGARKAMIHLLEAGHRDIGILGIRSPQPGRWERYVGTLGRRMAGYLAALEVYGMSMEDVHLTECTVTEEGGRRGLSRLLDKPNPPTAVVSMSDIVALGALAEALHRGLQVPGDLSIIGFDDIPETRWARPSLTTVSQSSQAKGRIAAQLLIDLISGDRQPEHILLETELVVRESVGPPR
ncbi:MAG TPA: LacI family DNA-binding transcriptional regulator [Acidimicrobiia bacterium]|nr:LacI family DNA-binding transcriptional regulator [Acidimicrobiia bacterium]